MAMIPTGLAKMLQEHGADVTFVSKGSGTYTPGSGFVAGTPDPETVRVYWSQYKEEEVDGVSILSGDRRVVFIPTSTTPKPKNGDTIGGLRVEGVREIFSGGPIVYICQIRD
jgi:hypothetical protein